MSKINGLFAWWMFTLASIFLLYEMGLQVSPSVMVADLMEDFQIGAKNLGLLSGLYFFSYAFMQIPSGLLFDRFSAKIILFVGCLSCSLGALFFSLTGEFFYACFGRILLGFGSSFAFVGTLVIASRWFYPSWFAFMAGSTQFLAGFGALVAAYPLAYAVDFYGWRASILALALFGILLSFLCLIFIKNQPDHIKSQAHTPRYGIVKSLKVLLHEPQNIYGAIYSFCTWGPLLVFAGLWGVPFFSMKFLISNTQAAFLVSMIWVGVSISSPLFGIISDWLKRRKIVLVVSSILGLIASMIVIYGPMVSDLFLGVVLFLFGVASASQILAFALIKENNPKHVIGTGMGFNNMAVVIGGAIFQPLVGFLMNQAKITVDHVYSLFSYQFALSIIPICFFIAAIVAVFFIKETFAQSKYDSE